MAFGRIIKSCCCLALIFTAATCAGDRNALLFPDPCNADGAPFGGGAGTAESPYYICSAAQLSQVQSFLDRSFVLRANIDLQGTSFSTIAPDSDSSDTDCDGTAFSGTFNGAGHTLSNFTVTTDTTNCIGLFGNGSGATLTRLTLENFAFSGAVTVYNNIATLIGYCSNCVISDITITGGSFNGNDRVVGAVVGLAAGTTSVTNTTSDWTILAAGNITGGLIGRMTDTSTLSESRSTSTLTTSGNSLGGLVGNMQNSTQITKSSYSGSATGTTRVGGVCGYMQDASSISKVSAEGSMSGSGSSVGGVVGTIQDTASISDCYSQSTLYTDVSDVAGIVGTTLNTPTVNRCYAAVTITGTLNQRGVVASRGGVPVFTDVFFDGDLFTAASHGCALGCTEKTTSELKTESTYSGWDFSTVWTISSGNYPSLR